MELISKAFIVRVNKISPRAYAVVILTQQYGQVAGILKGSRAPLITAFGVAKWSNSRANTYIQFEQTSPSLILNFLDAAENENIEMFIRIFEKIESFNELRTVVNNYLPAGRLGYNNDC